MIYIVFLLTSLIYMPCSTAYDTSNILHPLPSDTTISLEEIEKVTQILENPREREKILKTLKVLAKAKAVKEKKTPHNFTYFLSPVIEQTIDTLSTLVENIQRIPYAIKNFIGYIKVEKNRNDLWTALKWFPLFIITGFLLEAVIALFAKHALKRKTSINSNPDKGVEKNRIKFGQILSSFSLVPIILIGFFYYLPYNFSNKSIIFLICFWLIISFIRFYNLIRNHYFILFPTLSKYFFNTFDLINQCVYWYTIIILSTFWLNTVLSILYPYPSFENILNSIMLFLFLPCFVILIKEWQATWVPKYIEQTRTLLTTPLLLKNITNFLVKYTAWTLLVVAYLSWFNYVVSENTRYAVIFLQVCINCLVYLLFLWGRPKIDMLAYNKIQSADSVIIKSYINHIEPYRVRLVKALQWIWHIAYIVALLAIWNNSFSDLFLNILAYPATKTLLSLGIVWGIFFLVWTFAEAVANHYMQPRNNTGQNQPTPFAKTFGPMLHSIVRWIIILAGVFVTLEHFGLDLKLLVYLMSAFALAISLGAQSLVKDIINGIFALVDGSFAVGEVVSVGAFTGKVESLSLRALTLRHSAGYLQTIPFSEVGSIINRSRDYTVVPIALATSYKTKIETVYEALRITAQEMTDDAYFGQMIIEPPASFGIDKFDENAVHVSASFKIKPDPSNSFGREYNRRLKVHMEELGIMPPISFHEEWHNELLALPAS